MTLEPMTLNPCVSIWGVPVSTTFAAIGAAAVNRRTPPLRLAVPVPASMAMPPPPSRKVPPLSVKAPVPAVAVVRVLTSISKALAVPPVWLKRPVPSMLIARSLLLLMVKLPAERL